MEFEQENSFKLELFKSQNSAFECTVFTETNAHPDTSAHQKQSFFKGGVHKTDGLWWVIFQRGGVHKTNGFWRVLKCFSLLLKIKRPMRLFGQIRYIDFHVSLTKAGLCARHRDLKTDQLTKGQEDNQSISRRKWHSTFPENSDREDGMS